MVQGPCLEAALGRLTVSVPCVSAVTPCSAKARAHKGPVKVVYLLGSDDYKEGDVPADAFVIYQVKREGGLSMWRLDGTGVLLHIGCMLLCAVVLGQSGCLQMHMLPARRYGRQKVWRVAWAADGGLQWWPTTSRVAACLVSTMLHPPRAIARLAFLPPL